jgi:glucose/arabinose dehydrogenase
MGRMKPLRRPLLVIAMGGLLAACATPSPSAPGPSSVTGTSPANGSVPPTSSAGGSPATGEGPGSGGEPPALAIEEVGAGLIDPIGLLGAPDGSLLVNERAGRVMSLDPASGATSVILDIRDRVRGGGEQGLLGLALDPGWPDEGRAFVHYTDRDGDTVLSEFTASEGEGGARILDAASERTILTLEQPYANHNGGQLAFGRDG